MTKTPDDTPHELGRRTAEILRIRELSALSVSNAIGVHHTTLARFMDGESHLGAGALRRLAEHLGVSLDYLLGITDDITPKSRPSDDWIRETVTLLAKLSESQREVVHATARAMMRDSNPPEPRGRKR